MTQTLDVLGFVERHGLVLVSGRGPVPNLVEAIAGEPIRGSWWGHPKNKTIFARLSVLDDATEVKFFKLVGGKNTVVHRRLWPALVRLADALGRERLAEVRQEHTPSGAHKNVVTPFPEWVSADVASAAERLDEGAARALLPEGVFAPPKRRK